MSDSDSEIDMNTPPDIVNAATNATNNLLPLKSRAKYEKGYKDLLHYTANPDSGSFAETCVVILSYLLVIITLPLSLCMCFRVVSEFERAVIFRSGRIRKGGAKGPGMIFFLPCIDTFKKVDMRTVSFDVPPQEVLTRDSVTVSVDAVVYYRIRDPLNATIRVANAGASTRFLAATTLRNVLGIQTLAQLLSERENISHTMQSTLDVATDPWGVEVERVEIKDVRLPVELQRAMAAEAEADREARAKIITAKGEIKASQALKEASLIMVDNPMALQLRYLQSLNTISAEKNSTIIFPFPIDFMKTFVGAGKHNSYSGPSSLHV